MDDMSQVQEAPAATGPQTGPEAPRNAVPDMPAQPAAPETPSVPEGKMSPDDFRAKLRTGEIRTMMAEKGVSDPSEFISQFVHSEQPQESAPEAPAQQEAPAPQAAPEQPPQQPARPEILDKPSKEWRSDDFMEAAKALGITKYKNPYEALKSIPAGEKAINQYRQDAKKFRRGFEEQSLKNTELERQIKELSEKLEKNVATRPPSQPAPKIDVPDAPALPTLEGADPEEDNATVQSLAKAYEAREAALKAQAESQIKTLRGEFDQKTSNLERQFNSLKSEREREKLERQQEREKEALHQARNNAFLAARELGKKVDKYKLSKPVEAVDNDYAELIDDVKHLQAVNPRLQGRDLVAEYLNGNQETIDIFNDRRISVSDDVQTYMLMADLESDCVKHSLYVTQDGEKTGIPDFVKALRLREEDAGIRNQEIVDARVAGFEQANRLQDAPTAGARQLSPGETSTPPAASQPMTAESALEKLKALQNIKNLGKRAKAYAELKPLLIQHGLVPTSEGT